jgi:hypothetical protein
MNCVHKDDTAASSVVRLVRLGDFDLYVLGFDSFNWHLFILNERRSI